MHGEEERADCEVGHRCIEGAFLGCREAWEEAEVSWGYGFLSLLGRVGVFPCLEDAGDGREQLVGVLIVVNGARPPRIPEFRSQVPNGFFERPSKYLCQIFAIQLQSAFGI